MNWVTFSFVLGMGGGGEAPSPGVDLASVFCRSFATQQDFIDLRESLDVWIADPALLSASDLEYLDLDEDGSFTVMDRDEWMDFLGQQNLPELSRQAWSGTDPLDLLANMPANYIGIIIDPLNAAAVKVTRGENTCTEQDGTTPATPPELFTGTTLNHTEWYDLHSLDEQDWDTAGATITRFPDNSDTTTYIVYVRGPQTLDKEIGNFKNVAGGTAPNIVIMGYPTDRVQVNCGSSQYQSGEPGAAVADNLGKYRLTQAFGTWRAMRWQGIKFVGHRGDVGSRIFSHRMFRGFSRQHFRKCEILDWRGISPIDNPSDYTAYPEFVDSQFHNRQRASNGDIINPASGDNDPATPGSGIQLLTGVSATGSKIERCHIRHAPVDSPNWSQTLTPTFYRGDAVLVFHDATVISRCLFDGVVPHQQISIHNSSGENSIVEYCDVSNPQHSGIGVIASSCTVRYNRVHDFSKRADGDLAGNGIQVNPNTGLSITGVQLIGNVVWNIGGVATAGFGFGIVIGTSWTTAFNNSDGLCDQNILYGCGLFLGHLNGFSGSVHNIQGWTVTNNAIVDLSDGNRDYEHPVYDGALVMNLGENTVANNLWDNEVHDNLITRLDGSTAMVRILTGITTADAYEAEDAVAANYTGNYSSDPLFGDPAEGDFRFPAASDLTGQLVDADIPYLATPAWDAYESLALLCGIPGRFCCEITIRPQYEAISGLRPQYESISVLVECECS